MKLSDLGEIVDIPALEDKEWKPVALSHIFVNHHGKRLTKDKRTVGKLPLLTAGENNNGIADFISNPNMPVHSYFVSIDMFGNAFYHPYQATGDDNIYFFESEELSEYAKAFICVSIEKQACKFSYGKQFRQYNADNLHIMLPVNDSGEPDYEYMEQYARNMMIRKYRQYIDYLEREMNEIEREREKSNDLLIALEDKRWADFAIDAIFVIQSGKRLENKNKAPGNRPFVGALDHDNGISGFVSNDNDSKDSNVLGVNYNGNGMGLCFYHPYKCIFSDDVKRFHLKAMHNNPYVLLFVKVLIERQRGKFGYLYKFNAKRMASTNIMLPVNDSGEPDYAYMEQYGRKMMADKYRQYLDYLRG